ncbi:MAG TPA: SDR family NAD(P)-dependent oxidoreductase [Methanoregulaceae archaeon]|nr:SDR family NAD(P)-dependent oxidoreductase [Methanoregulaceae archaeon]
MNPVLVTGSTDGIGRAAATLLASAGRSVIVHGKDPAKGAAVVSELRARYPTAAIDLVTADLRDPDAIAGIADAVRDRHGELDALVNNAGVYMRERVLTPEGLETTFAVNGLAPFRVTRALASLLRPPRRVVYTASVAHFSTDSIDWEDLQGERHYNGYAAYSLTKLGAVLLARGLADRGFEAVSLHPGVCATKLLAAGFPGSRGAPPEHCGRNEARLATIDRVEPGTYYDQTAAGQPSRLARDPELVRRWCGMLHSFG